MFFIWLGVNLGLLQSMLTVPNETPCWGDQQPKQPMAIWSCELPVLHLVSFFLLVWRWGFTARTRKHIHTEGLYIVSIPPLNSQFCVTVSLWTAFFCRTTGRIKSEFNLALTEMLFYPFLIVSHIGVNTRVYRRGTFFTPWHNPCEEPFTLQRSTAVAVTRVWCFSYGGSTNHSGLNTLFVVVFISGAAFLIRDKVHVGDLKCIRRVLVVFSVKFPATHGTCDFITSGLFAQWNWLYCWIVRREARTHLE